MKSLADLRKQVAENYLQVLIDAVTVDALPAVAELVTVIGAEEATMRIGGYTALHCAASQRRVRVASILLNSAYGQAAINIPDDYGRSALYLSSSNPELIKLLLAAGADPNTALGDGSTPLSQACKSGDVDCVKAFTDKKKHIKRETLDHALTSAVFQNLHPEVISVIILLGADVNLKVPYEGEETSLLTIALRKKFVPVIDLLLEKGARLGKSISAPLLQSAVELGHLDIVKSLLSNGASPNTAIPLPSPNDVVVALRTGMEGTVPVHRETLLHIAIRVGNRKMVSLLVSKGADTEIRTAKGDGFTALHYAAMLVQ